MKIGIIGNGFVGKATFILKCIDIDIIVYDINPDLCIPRNMSLENLVETSDVIFISVPTPMSDTGKCHLDILKNVINQIKLYCDINQKLIVSRCTVPPGTSDLNNCYFMPEFLTEKNFKQDFINNAQWVFGLKNNTKFQLQNLFFKKTMTKMINLAYNNNCIKYNDIKFVTNSEAEMIKLFRNCFLATKVSFCNELYKYCEKINVDYETVRNIAVMDNRIGESHTKVPGHDNKFGFGGTCFPKDMNNLNYEMINSGLFPYIINASLKRNENIDRIEKDWEDDEGRAIIKNKK